MRARALLRRGRGFAGVGTPAGGLPTLDFFVDWRTATGTSANAITDGSKIGTTGGSGQEVIASTGLDMPSGMTNVMRVTALQSNGGYAFLRKTGLTVPSSGSARYYRWYSRLPQGINVAVADPETHPHQDGNAAGSSNWLFHVYHSTPGSTTGWTPQLRVRTTPNPYPDDRWTGPVLSYDTTYRFELQIDRTGTTTFQMHVRIYDSANTLLYDDADFDNQNTTDTLETFQASTDFVWYDVTEMGGLNMGLNGLGGTDFGSSVVYMYQGGVATGINCGWIGAYRAENG